MKRTIAVLLVLAVLACALGMAALAEDGNEVAEVGGTKYTSLDTALTNATGDNATVTLLKDIELSSAVEVKSSVTIAGGGHTISRGKTTEGADYTDTFFTVSDEGTTLTLSDVVIDAGGKWSIDKTKYDEALATSKTGVAATGTENIIVSTGAVETTDHLITLADGASLDVKDGSKITNFYTKNKHIVQITSGAGSVSLTDCEISHGASANQFIVNDANNDSVNEITIGDGCVIKDNFVYGNGGLFLVGNATTLEITGTAQIINNTTFGNGTVVMVYKYNNNEYSDKLIISGGTISSNVGIYTGANRFCSPIYIHSGGELEMSGGSIIDNTGCYVGAIMENEHAKNVSITGGSVHDNYYVHSVPESMATQGYPSAGMGEIFLGAPATFGDEAVIDSDVYVGWGGQLENSGEINGDTYVYASQSGNQKAHLNNTGEITGTVTAQKGAEVENSGTLADLVINNDEEKNASYKNTDGTVTNTEQGTISGTVTLEPGTSMQLGKGDDAPTVSVDKDAESGAEFKIGEDAVTMTKGTVTTTNSTGVTFKDANGNELTPVDGKVVVPVAQINTTTYGTLKAAVDAANDNDTIELLMDAELGSVLEINNSVTIAGNGYAVTRGKTTTGDTYTGTLFTVSDGKTLTLDGVTIDAGGKWSIDAEKWAADKKISLEQNLPVYRGSWENGAEDPVVVGDGNVVTTANLIVLDGTAGLVLDGGTVIQNMYANSELHIIGWGTTANGDTPNEITINDAAIKQNLGKGSLVAALGRKANISLNSGAVLADNFNLSGANGGLFYLNNGSSLTMAEGAEVTGNRGVNCNGTFFMSYGEGTVATMNGGTVSNNEGLKGTNTYCQPIYTHTGGTFIMNGGSITDNTGCNAGAIAQNPKANTTVELNGGTIENNHYHGEGELLGYGEVFLSGKATIGEDVHITGEVGIYGQANVTVEEGNVIDGSVFVWSERNVESMTDYKAELNGTINGDLYLQETAKVTNNGTIEGNVTVADYDPGKDLHCEGPFINKGTITGTVTLTGGASVQLDVSVENPPSVTAGANGAKFTVSGSTVTLTEGTLDAANCDDINFRDTANNELEPADGDGNGEVMIIVARVTHGSGFSEGFDNFADAIAEAKSLSETNGGTYTVTLLKDAEGVGIDIAPTSGKSPSIVIDFNGHTYTLTGSPVGSANTKTQGMRSQKGATVTLKNGTLAVTEDNGTFEQNFLWLINNYGDLTVENMTLDGTNLVMLSDEAIYTLNSNYGKVSITKTTFIDSNSQADGEVYSMRALYSASSAYGGVSQITIDDESVFNKVFVARSAENTREFDGMMAYVEYNGVKYGIDATDKTVNSYIVFAKDGDTLTPKLPDFTLSYSALANTEIVETCVAQTMWVQFNEDLPENTWLWFEITDEAGHTWGIVGHAEEGTAKMAWSFLTKTQFEMWPTGVESITDGPYTVTCYVLPGKVEGTQTTSPETKYFVWEKTVKVQSDMIPQAASPVVEVGETINPTDKDTVTAAANQTAIDDGHMAELTQEAMTEATAPTDAQMEQAKEDLNNAEEVHVVVQTYLDVKVTEYEEEGNDKRLTFEIEPMYQVVATTAESVDDIHLTSDDGEVNAVVLGQPKELSVTDPVTMTLGVPSDFLGGSTTIYVQHVKENDRTYYYRAKVGSDNTITFTNPHGFSTFTVIVTAPEFKAEIGDTLYETLKDAVEHVQNGETIVVTGDCSSENVTVGRSVSFSVTVNEDAQAGTITAGNGYSMTSSVSGTTTTYTVTYSGGGSVSGSSTYTVSAEEAENAEVELSTEKATAGDSVTVTVTPAENFHVSGVTVTGADGKEITVVDNGDGTFTFTMPSGGVTVKAETFKCPSVEYTDIDVTEWYHDYVDYAITHDLMDGFGDGVFAPEKTVTRAQMAGILWNLEGQPVVNYLMTFTDVPDGKWYTEAIRWAASEGIISGFGDNTFRPEDIITREQMAAMLYFYEEYKNGDHTVDAELTFTDSGEVSSWANEAVVWCVGKDLIHGKGGNAFDPRGTSIRAQLATLLALYDQMDK